MAHSKRSKILEVSIGAESVRVTVDADTDLEQPFIGECDDTGEQLRFPHPWMLDIEVVGNGISEVV